MAGNSIASVEHTENGNIISKASEVEVPEKYYTPSKFVSTATATGSGRNTFIVMNTESGEFKQVGKKLPEGLHWWLEC